MVLDLGRYQHSLIGQDDLDQIHQNLKAIKQLMTTWTTEGRLSINVLSETGIDERNNKWFDQHRAQEQNRLRNEAAGGLLDRMSDAATDSSWPVRAMR